MRKIIAFIGPSMVGKTTISKHISNKLGLNRISTDVLCLNHSYDINDNMDFIDDLTEYVHSTNVSIIDIGSNTIENCSKKELQYLKDSLTIDGVEPVFYLLLPHKKPHKSYNFLCKMAKKLNCYMPEVLISISESLNFRNVDVLNPNIIYTLGESAQIVYNDKSYKKRLLKISDEIIEGLEEELETIFNEQTM